MGENAGLPLLLTGPPPPPPPPPSNIFYLIKHKFRVTTLSLYFINTHQQQTAFENSVVKEEIAGLVAAELEEPKIWI